MEINMLEILISGGNVLLLAGCFYVAYVILLASRVRAAPRGQKAPSNPADYELLFRKPSADYYI
jgi:hypothetical protein